MNKKVKKSPNRDASVKIVREMIKKHGPNFMSDFEDLDKFKPLYAGLCYYLGETKLTPLFSTALKAADFVEITRDYVDEMRNVKVKIVKLTVV